MRRTQNAAIAVAHAGLITAVGQASDGIVLTDRHGTMQYVNPAFTAMTGYSAEEAVGQNSRLLGSGRQGAAFYQEMWATLRAGRVWQGEVTNRRKDGSLYEEEMRIAPVWDAEGAVTGYLAIKHDVTEQRAAAAAQTFLAAITEHCEDAIVATTRAGVILTWNHGAEAIFGFTAAEALGRDVSLFTPADRMPRMMDCIDRVGGGEVLKNLQGICQRADGRRIHVTATGFPIRNASGTVVATVALLRDSTEPHRAEQQLRESEERFRIMADSCPIGIWVIDAQGMNRFVNRTYLEICGLTADEIEGEKWKKLVHPDDAEEFLGKFERAMASHAPFTAIRRSRRADGEWRWVESHGAPRFSADGEFLGMVGTSKDITERRRGEEARQESEERFRQLTENIHQVFWMMNRAGTEILYIAPAYERVWGRSCQSLYENPMSWMEAVHPEDRERVRTMFLRQLRGESFDSDYRILAPEGQQRWIRDRAFPVRNEKGELIRIARVAEDITERRHYETELIRAREEADAASNAKSRFLANMSHEIRTPMNGVIGMTQLLAGTSLTPEQRHYVEVAQYSGRTLLALIDDILDLSKIESGKIVLEKAIFNLRDTVEDVVRLLSVQAGAKGLRIETHLSAKIPTLLCGDAHRLRQVLTNLCANAIKFTVRGTIRVEAEAETVSGTTAEVRFAVSDTGIGIDEGQMGALFSPFFQGDASTTRRYGGTGLGLAISKQLVEKMGGDIGVESHKDVGSRFWFTAAFEQTAQEGCATAAEQRESEEGALEIPQGHGETILVAEDNFTNREVMFAQLKKLGYKARAVANGAEAVEACSSRHYDLVLMDCAMPVMDGYEATHRIRALGQKRIPIIALTAGAMAQDRQRCLAEGMDDYLAKPAELPRLAQTLVRWIAPSSPEPASAPVPDGVVAHEAPVFDASALVRRLMGDRELAGVILQAFRDDVPQQLAHLRRCAAEEDAAGVRLQAHAVKGAAANVGGEALRQAAYTMEMAAAAGNLGEIGAAMLDVERAWLELNKAIEEEWDAAEE